MRSMVEGAAARRDAPVAQLSHQAAPPPPPSAVPLPRAFAQGGCAHTRRLAVAPPSSVTILMRPGSPRRPPGTIPMLRDRSPIEIHDNYLIPQVIENTSRGERGFDIYSRLLRRNESSS